MKTSYIAALIAVFLGLLAAINPAFAAWITPEHAETASLGLMALGTVGSSGIDEVMQSLDKLEAKMGKYADKAEFEAKFGEISTETKTALEKLGEEQKAMADELLQFKQRSAANEQSNEKKQSIGEQFAAAEEYKAFAGRLNSGTKGRNVGIEVKNTVTNTVANTFSDRQPGVVGGAFRVLRLLDLLTIIPTSSNSIDYVRENVFTNSAAEVAEGGAAAESAVTFTPVNEPVANIAHFVKISKQLAADNAALAAYIDTRMMYGVDLRLENQIIQGPGTSNQISGFTKSGNFTAHGYTAALLTAAGLSATNRFDLIGKIIGDLQAADWPADTIVLNPTDWWTIRLTKDSQGRYLLGDPGQVIAPSLFGLPVVASNAVTADNVLVASLAQAATFYDRQSVVVEMSDSDSDNFTKQLVTLMATRRGALAVERPAAVRYGDLTPA